MGMKEWFFLYGVALHAPHVTPRNIELASSIESNLANSGSAFRDRAAMAARETADSPIVEFLVKLAFANVVTKNVSHGGHRALVSGLTATNCIMSAFRIQIGGYLARLKNGALPGLLGGTIHHGRKGRSTFSWRPLPCELKQPLCRRLPRIRIPRQLNIFYLRPGPQGNPG